MGIRRSAAALPPQERDRFVEAIIRMKHRPAPNGPAGFSVYDQFVALHGAVMAVVVPGAADPVNFGHWNPAFSPWHREYLLHFERALQAEVPGVTLPYWDWSDHLGAQQRVFVTDFLGPLMQGSPAPLPMGVLGRDGPTPRPAWWPPGANGYRINRRLQEQPAPTPVLRETLHRGSVGESWPPSTVDVQKLVTLDASTATSHRYWTFWTMIEQGLDTVERTHNAGHRFIGGHMAGVFSPNDPIFWLHHANIDRLWAIWQANMLAAHAGTTHVDHYPPQGDEDPTSGEKLPPGHNINDLMWPWVGTAPGYAPRNPAFVPLIVNYSTQPARRLSDVLDIAALGYSYA